MTIPTETLPAPGLGAAAEILIDRWGIPHIYAASDSDAFFAQGFNAARDRLWQIDLWRKRGLGLLARERQPLLSDERQRLARHATALAVFVFVMVLSGALVAGTRAGPDGQEGTSDSALKSYCAGGTGLASDRVVPGGSRLSPLRS